MSIFFLWEKPFLQNWGNTVHFVPIFLGVCITLLGSIKSCIIFVVVVYLSLGNLPHHQAHCMSIKIWDARYLATLHLSLPCKEDNIWTNPVYTSKVRNRSYAEDPSQICIRSRDCFVLGSWSRILRLYPIFELNMDQLILKKMEGRSTEFVGAYGVSRNSLSPPKCFCFLLH